MKKSYRCAKNGLIPDEIFKHVGVYIFFKINSLPTSDY